MYLNLSEVNKKEIDIWICDFEISLLENKMWNVSSKNND